MSWWANAVVAIVLLVQLAGAEVPLGCNVGGLDDWSRSLPFANMMRTGRRFGSWKTPWDGNVTLDANGWPTTDFGFVLFSAQLGPDVEGYYYITYSGNANVAVTSSVNATMVNVTYDSNAGKTTGVMKVGYTTSVILSFTNTNGGIRDVAVYKQGVDSSQTFDPTFLSIMSPFRGVLRFMDWGATNANSLSSWVNRPKPTDAQWTRQGAPLEIQVELGNTLNRDIWVNIPFYADDDYVRNAATLIKDNLNSNLNVYVEYCNELWNFAFIQFDWNVDAANATVMANSSSFLNYDKINNVWYWSYRRTAWRLMQISNIFADVWGQSAINTRVRCVLAGQMAQAVIVKTGLDMININFGPPNKYFYAISGAPYFSVGSTNSWTNLTETNVINALAAAAAKSASTYQYEYHSVIARKYGLKVVAYEGGTDTSNGNSNTTAARLATSFDPYMATIMTGYLNTWFGFEFDLFNYYVCDPTQTWGLSESRTDLSSYKYQAAKAFVQTTPAITGGVGIVGAAGGLIDSRFYATRGSNWNASAYWGPATTGEYDYLINSQVNGVYAFSISFANISGPVNKSLNVSVDWQNLVALQIPAPNGINNWTFSGPVNVTMRQGINILNLNLVGYMFRMQWFKFQLLEAIGPITTTTTTTATDSSAGNSGQTTDAPVSGSIGTSANGVVDSAASFSGIALSGVVACILAALL